MEIVRGIYAAVDAFVSGISAVAGLRILGKPVRRSNYKTLAVFPETMKHRSFCQDRLGTHVRNLGVTKRFFRAGCISLGV
jgi:hypothetical protein